MGHATVHPDTVACPASATANPELSSGAFRRTSFQRIAAAGTVTAFAALTIAFHFVDPHQGGYGTCPVYALTGLYCPGCGSLRAMYDLTRGNPTEALGHNVLAVIALPVIVAVLLWMLLPVRWRPQRSPHPAGTSVPVGAQSDIPKSSRFVRINWPIVALIIIVVFTVVRNLPFGATLAP